MYCSYCGHPVPDDARFCGGCGKPIAGLPGARAGEARRRMAKHLPILALLWAVYSMLRILAGGTAIFAGSMFMLRILVHGYRPFGVHFLDWPASHAMLRDMVVGVGTGELLLGVLGLSAAWGLSQRETWGRLLTIVLGILALFRLPLGTALGIYTLWALIPREAAAEYKRPAAVN